MKAIFTNPKKIIILTIIVFISLSYNSYSQQYSKSDYPLFGLAIGSPGGINIIGGRHVDILLLKFSLGAIYNGNTLYYGAQFNAMLNMINTASFESNIGLGIGTQSGQSDHVNVIIKTISYYGLFVDFNIEGIYLELGYVTPNKDTSISNLRFQIGYVYRFND